MLVELMKKRTDLLCFMGNTHSNFDNYIILSAMWEMCYVTLE